MIAIRRVLLPLISMLVLGLSWTGVSGPAAAAGARGLCAEELAYGAPRRHQATRRSALVSLCKHDAARGESFYLVAYDKRRRSPSWTAYRLTAAEVDAAAASGITRRGGGGFFAEPGLLWPGQGIGIVAGGDYRGAGLDRGHLVPAASMAFDPDAYAASFSVANVALQDARLNRGAWRRLEAAVRDWARARGEIHVITGVIFDGGQQGFAPLDKPRMRIVVPAAFYKVVYDPAAQEMIAFLFDNAPPRHRDLARAALSVERLEARSGIDFFPLMPAGLAEALERRAPDPAAWGLSGGAPAAGDAFLPKAEAQAARRPED